jgi:hypothetical protein
MRLEHGEKPTMITSTNQVVGANPGNSIWTILADGGTDKLNIKLIK